MKTRFFVFGAGYSGKAIARAALAAGAEAVGTTRSHEKADLLRRHGIAPLIFDGRPSDELAGALARTTHLVVSIAPEHGMRDGDAGEGSVDPVLDALGGNPASAMPELRWIGYLSTIGVYGDHGGAWIDETAECRPKSRRSKMRLQAERAWLDLAAETGIPVAVLRLSGIYGPGRNGFANLNKGTARRIVKPGQVFNRIHVDDIVGSTLHLAGREMSGVFNVTDDEPAPPQEVVAYAASLMGVEPPPEVPFEEADMTPMARSFYGENKRVSNARLKEAGYRFAFPDYRLALDELWRSRNWAGAAGGSDARSKIGR